MMQQMAGQQQGLNQQGLQLALGKMAAATQQQMMQQMTKGQKGLRKSLEQLMNEMRQSGGGELGDLSGIGKEMDEVIKEGYTDLNPYFIYANFNKGDGIRYERRKDCFDIL